MPIKMLLQQKNCNQRLTVFILFFCYVFYDMCEELHKKMLIVKSWNIHKKRFLKVVGIWHGSYFLKQNQNENN